MPLEARIHSLSMGKLPARPSLDQCQGCTLRARKSIGVSCGRGLTGIQSPSAARCGSWVPPQASAWCYPVRTVRRKLVQYMQKGTRVQYSTVLSIDLWRVALPKSIMSHQAHLSFLRFGAVTCLSAQRVRAQVRRYLRIALHLYLHSAFNVFVNRARSRRIPIQWHP